MIAGGFWLKRVAALEGCKEDLKVYAARLLAAGVTHPCHFLVVI